MYCLRDSTRSKASGYLINVRNFAKEDRMKKVSLFFILISFLFFIDNAYSQEIKAIFTHIQGDAFISKNGTDWIKPKKGDIISIGDTIKTSNNSIADIQIGDSSIIRIAQKTVFEFGELYSEQITKKTLFSTNTIQQNNIKIKLTTGQILSNVKKLKKVENTYKISTPTSVVGVRGTIFSTEFSNDQTNVNVIEGSVSVKNIIFPEEEIIVNSGYSTTIAINQFPTEPTPIPQDRINSLKLLLEEMEYYNTMFIKESLKTGIVPSGNSNAPNYQNTPLIPQNKQGTIEFKIDVAE